jgi:hypothetical protein
MSDSERKLLTALAMMVEQYLDGYMGEVYSRQMLADELALETLTEFGRKGFSRLLKKSLGDAQ